MFHRHDGQTRKALNRPRQLRWGHLLAFGSQRIAVTSALWVLIATSSARATDFLLDEVTCEDAFGGAWDGTASSCEVTDFELIDTDVLEIPPSASLVLKGDSLNEGELLVRGTLDNLDRFSNAFGSILTNLGTLNNDGELHNAGALGSSGTLRNSERGKLENGGSMTSGGSFVNEGELINLADFRTSGDLSNEKTLINDGTLTNAGIMVNHLELTNAGTINNGTINLATGSALPGRLHNSGTLRNDGALINEQKSTLRNDVLGLLRGNLTNTGSLTNRSRAVPPQATGGFSNHGDLVNLTGLISNAGSLELSPGATITQSGAELDNLDGALLVGVAAISNAAGSRLTNFGELRLEESSSFSNDASHVSNHPGASWLTPSVDVTNSAGARFDNEGRVELLSLFNDASTFHNTGQWSAVLISNQARSSVFNNQGGQLSSVSVLNESGSRFINGAGSQARALNTLNRSVVSNNGQWLGPFDNYCSATLFNNGAMGAVINHEGEIQGTGSMALLLELGVCD